MFARPWLHLKAQLFGSPRLPVPGATLAHAFLSPLTVASERSEVLVSLIRLGAAHAATKGIEYITLGFDARDSRLQTVCKGFPCRKYLSRLYQVQWPGAELVSEPLEGRTLVPDIASL